MYKKTIIAVVIILLTIFVTVQVRGKMMNQQIESGNTGNYPTIFGNNLYLSNRYTQPDDLRLVNADNTIPVEYELLATNDDVELYFNSETLEFKVKNLKTGYVWNSSGQNLREGGLNATNRDIMRSPVYMEYYPYVEKTDEVVATLKRASAYDAKHTITKLDNGVVINFNYNKLDISFDLYVTLESDGLVVRIPNDSITEVNNKIATIYLFTNFGSTFSDSTPGYMFIPDGVGALYRFKDNSAIKNVSHYQTRFYGYDIGLSQARSEGSAVTIPVYGMVHGINQNAFVAVVEEGAYNAALHINPSGANSINYNWIGPKFIFRETYVYPTNLKGDGITVIQEDKNNENLQIRLLFTENDEANYVGMARKYQDYLVRNEILKPFASNEVKLRLEILATDSENGLFGPKTLKMTDIEETEDIINTLYDAGISEQLVVLRGWNKDGMSGETPYQIKLEKKFASKKELAKLQAKLTEKLIELYFYNDYIKAYETSNVVNPRNDFARGIYKRRIENNINGILYQKYNYLNPQSTLELSKDDVSKYEKLGIDNLALDSIGSILYSTYYNKKNYNRYDNVQYYLKALDQLVKRQNIALYQPNAYLWKYINNYLDIPMYNTQVTIFDDTVPFLPIVLKGYVDYYSPFINFFANPEEQLLLLVDYGIYPSYIVTFEPTHKLNFTNANVFFTTEFRLWKDKIISHYNTLAEALNPVSQTCIKSRTMLDIGIAEVTYENGVKFIINYTDTEYEYGEIVISPKSFIVEGGSQQ